MGFFHQYQETRHRAKLVAARPYDRAIAQLVDGIILWIVTGVLLYLASSGTIRTIWVSPVLPLYLLEVGSSSGSGTLDWIWGGAFVSFDIPFLKTIHVQFPAPLLWLLYAAYYTLFTAFWGQTPGKMLKGLVVLNASLQFPGFHLALVRWIATVGSMLTLGAGLAVAGPEGERPAWHDRWSQTGVYRFPIDGS